MIHSPKYCTFRRKVSNFTVQIQPLFLRLNLRERECRKFFFQFGCFNVFVYYFITCKVKLYIRIKQDYR